MVEKNFYKRSNILAQQRNSTTFRIEIQPLIATQYFSEVINKTLIKTSWLTKEWVNILCLSQFICTVFKKVL